MKLIISAILLTFSFSFFSCSTCPKDTKPTFDRLVLGMGGGSSGINNGYIIDSVGNVYKWMGKPDISIAEKLDVLCDNEIDQINEIIMLNNLQTMKYENIGNFYNFFNIFFNQKSNYIVWQASSNNENDKKLSEIYSKILKIIDVN